MSSSKIFIIYLGLSSHDLNIFSLSTKEIGVGSKSSNGRTIRESLGNCCGGTCIFQLQENQIDL